MTKHSLNRSHPRPSQSTVASGPPATGLSSERSASGWFALAPESWQREWAGVCLGLAQCLLHPDQQFSRLMRLQEDLMRAGLEAGSDWFRFMDVQRQHLGEQWRQGLALVRAESLIKRQVAWAELSASIHGFLRVGAHAMTQFGARWTEPWARLCPSMGDDESAEL